MNTPFDDIRCMVFIFDTTKNGMMLKDPLNRYGGIVKTTKVLTNPVDTDYSLNSGHFFDDG